MSVLHTILMLNHLCPPISVLCRGLMHETPFISDYTSLTTDGAEWIVKNGGIELVGIDYTSIATYADLKGPHLALLPNVSKA